MDVIEMQRWAYVQDLPSDIDPVRHFLRTYSRIPEEHVDSHLRRVVSPVVRQHRRVYRLLTGPRLLSDP